jgi:cytochrome c553
MRILGTVPLEEDGSATFRIPANTPVAVQALDKEGQAVQIMRSWFTVMPGETLSCVGCHERPADVTPSALALAMRLEPRDIEPWRGPARGFDFTREVQPVLNKHCASCHDGGKAKPDLRPQDPNDAVRYTSAYRAMIPYVHRVGIDGDAGLLTPGAYHADTSKLIQLLRKGHEGVRLDAEGWDRIVTWIDLNAPCYGTWGEAAPIPQDGHVRRMELRKTCGGPPEDPETIPDCPKYGDSQADGAGGSNL